MFSLEADEVEGHGAEDTENEASDEDEQDQVDGCVRHGPEPKVQEQPESHQETWKQERVW